MNEENRNKRFNNKGLTIFEVIIIIVFAIFFAVYWLNRPQIQISYEQPPLVACQSNMRSFGLAIQMYADENSGSYPLPDKWYDLVCPYFGNAADELNHCPAIKEYKYYYAMNPDCKANSPPDTVLLFETQDSNWNLLGGPELLTTENHKEHVCNVLFNDGSVATVKKEEIPNLKWNAEKIIE